MLYVVNTWNKTLFRKGFVYLQPTDAALFINGMHFDMDYVDIFSLLDTIKSEANVLDGLGKIGLTDEQARKVVALDFSGNKQTYGIDIRYSNCKFETSKVPSKLMGRSFDYSSFKISGLFLRKIH